MPEPGIARDDVEAGDDGLQAVEPVGALLGGDVRDILTRLRQD